MMISSTTIEIHTLLEKKLNVQRLLAKQLNVPLHHLPPQVPALKTASECIGRVNNKDSATLIAFEDADPSHRGWRHQGC